MAATSTVEYVKVTGLKETTSVADIVAYFESERFGGGTVSVVVLQGRYNTGAVVGLSNVDSNALSKATHRIGDAKVRVVSHATPPTEDERIEAAYIAGKTVPAEASNKLGATQGTECSTAVKEPSSDSLPQNIEEATLPVSIFESASTSSNHPTGSNTGPEEATQGTECSTAVKEPPSDSLPQNIEEATHPVSVFESASTSSNHPTGSNTGPEEAGTIILSTIAPGEGTDIYFECKELSQPISEENLKSLFSEHNLHLLTGDSVGRFDVVHVDVKEIIGEESYVVKLTIRVDEVDTLDDLRSALYGTHQCQGGLVDIKKCSEEAKRRYNAQCAPKTNTTTELTKATDSKQDEAAHLKHPSEVQHTLEGTSTISPDTGLEPACLDDATSRSQSNEEGQCDLGRTYTNTITPGPAVQGVPEIHPETGDDEDFYDCDSGSEAQLETLKEDASTGEVVTNPDLSKPKTESRPRTDTVQTDKVQLKPNEPKEDDTKSGYPDLQSKHLPSDIIAGITPESTSTDMPSSTVARRTTPETTSTDMPSATAGTTPEQTSHNVPSNTRRTASKPTSTDVPSTTAGISPGPESTDIPSNARRTTLGSRSIPSVNCNFNGTPTTPALEITGNFGKQYNDRRSSSGTVTSLSNPTIPTSSLSSTNLPKPTPEPQYILVTGLIPSMSTEDIVSYFQSYRCGAGTVTEMVFADDSRSAALLGISRIELNDSHKMFQGGHRIGKRKVKVSLSEATPTREQREHYRVFPDAVMPERECAERLHTPPPPAHPKPVDMDRLLNSFEADISRGGEMFVLAQGQHIGYILVTGLTPSMSTEDIVSYLQSYRCGAGTVTVMVFTDDSRSAALLGISGIELNDSCRLFSGVHIVQGAKLSVDRCTKVPASVRKECVVYSYSVPQSDMTAEGTGRNFSSEALTQNQQRSVEGQLTPLKQEVDRADVPTLSEESSLHQLASGARMLSAIASLDDSRQRSDFSTSPSGSTVFATGSKPGSIRSELSSSFPPLVDDVPVYPLLSRDDDPPIYIIVSGLTSSVSLQDLVTHLESPRYGTGTVTVVTYLHNQRTALVGMTGLRHTSGLNPLTTRAHSIGKVKLHVKLTDRPPTKNQLKNAAFNKAATPNVVFERSFPNSDRQQPPHSSWFNWSDGNTVNSFSSTKKLTDMPSLEHDSSSKQPIRATLQAGSTSLSTAPEGRLENSDTQNVNVSVVGDESIARAGATMHPPGQGRTTSRGPPPGFVRPNIPSGSIHSEYDHLPGLVLPNMPSGSSQSGYDPSSSSFIPPNMPALLPSQPNNISHSGQRTTAVTELAHEVERSSQPIGKIKSSSHPKSNMIPSAGAREVTVQSSFSGAEKPRSESVSSPVSQRPGTASMRSIVVKNLPHDWDEDTTKMAFDNPEIGGGEISSVCKNVITFKDVTVAAGLIKQGRFVITEQSLKISPYHPPQDPLESVLRERGLTTDNTLVFDKVPAHIRDEQIELYLESICSLSYKDFQLIRKTDKDLRILFVLKDRAKGKLLQCLQSVRSTTRPLDRGNNTSLSAARLEPITTLVVENIKKAYHKESFLKMYFGNQSKSGGGKVKQVRLLRNDTAAVFFEDPNVVLNVLASLPLHMATLGCDVSLQMHHPVLTPHFLPSSTHVPGSDTRVFQHKVIELPISEVMAELFGENTSHVSFFSGRLQSDGCATASLKPNAQSISISPSPGSEYIEDWASQCKGKFKVFMEEFHEESLNVPHPVGGQVYSVILTSAKSADVHVKVSSENAGGKCILAGKKQPVKNLLQTVRTIIRQNHTKMGDIRLPHKILIYIDKCIQAKLQADHPKIIFKLDIKKGTLHASGTEETYDDFVKAINSLNPVVEVANLEEEVVALLAKDIGFLQGRMPQKKTVSFYFIGPDGSPSSDGLSTVSKLHFVSDSRQQALDVIKSLKAAVAVDHFKVPSEMFNLLHSPQWTKTFRNLESQFLIHITPYPKKRHLSVACDKQHLDLIRRSLQEFVEKECFIHVDITMEEGEWEYLEAYSKDWKRLDIEMEKTSIKFSTPDRNSSGGRPCITLDGEKTPVTELSGRIRSLIKGIKRAKKEISRPGTAKHFLSTAGKHQLAGVGTANRAVVKVTTQDEQCKEESAVQSSSPHRLLCSGSIAGRVVEIRKGDLTEFPVDVIVNAANEQLNHSGGIAGIISQKGGPSIQKDSTEYVEQSGSLSVGEAVLRPAVGTLPCKAIVHAVGPRWRGGQDNEEALLVKTIRESLKAAKKYKSIGFPAISAGIFGMPVQISARAMLKGIKEYFSENEATLLTNVTIMLFDEKTIPDFITSAQNTLQNVTVKQNTSASTPHRTAADVEYDYTQTAPEASVFERHGSTSSVRRINVPPAVQLKKGSLTDFTADVYVNTAHTALDLNHGAVAKSLLKAGGPQLQKECTDFVQQHGKVPEWGHAVTRGGNLQCRHVIHAVGGNYSHGQSAEKGMSTMITNIMAECDRLGATSVAFPAIGTGGLGFPDEVVAKVMLQSIANYYSTHHGCRIKQVLLVVFMDKTHKAFKDKIEGHQNPSQHRAKPMSVPHVSSRTIATEEDVLFSPETTQLQDMVSSSIDSATLQSFALSNIAIDIIRGDLTNEKCDGLVSTSSENLHLQSFGVMGALLRKGGPELQHECSIAAAQYGNLSGSKVIVTGVGRPGGLTCTRILHVLAPNHSGQLCNVVAAVLKRANEEKLSVVALPAIGTGVHGFTPEESARGICEAIVEFSKSNPTSVSQIKVVLFQKEHYSSFASAFANAGNQAGLIKRAWNYTKNLFTAPGHSKQPSSMPVHRPVRSNTAPAGIKEDTVLSIRVYAGDEKSAQLVLSEVAEMVQDNYFQSKIENDYVDKLSVEVRRRLEQEAKDSHVVLTFDRAPLNAIHLKGNHSDCSEIRHLVEEKLKQLEQDDRKRKHAEDRISKVQWQWLKDDKFQDYNPMDSFQIEEAYQSGKRSVDLSTTEGPVTVDTRALNETQTSPPFSTVEIKRRDFDEEKKLGESPPTWDPMPLDPNTNNEVACHLVDLPLHSLEYQEVKRAFEATMGQGAHVPGTPHVNRGIKKIERVQNRKLWLQYSACKKVMDKANPPGTVNEKKLFHGCASKDVPSINHTGFNRSYAGVHATAYGKGMYFARDASYSARYSSCDPIQTQLRQTFGSIQPQHVPFSPDCPMYLARVLTGEFTKGGGSMIQPPPKNVARPNVPFDSVVDKTARPSIFVVFFDAQAYPDYLITFHT